MVKIHPLIQRSNAIKFACCHLSEFIHLCILKNLLPITTARITFTLFLLFPLSGMWVSVPSAKATLTFASVISSPLNTLIFSPYSITRRFIVQAEGKSFYFRTLLVIVQKLYFIYNQKIRELIEKYDGGLAKIAEK